MPRRKTERQSAIAAELQIRPSMRVHELAERLNVSVETVRRDLAELEKKGLLSRTFGGAVRPITLEPALNEREGMLVAERERIAAAACRLIEKNDILMIGGGSTTLHLARRIAAQVEHITVITHAFGIAVALASNPRIKVMVLPGQYAGREGFIFGGETIEALQHFHADRAFLGATGLTNEGPNDASTAAGLIYGTMMRRASEVFILADHSKFDRPSLTVFGSWNQVSALITDRRPKGELDEVLTANSVRTIIG